MRTIATLVALAATLTFGATRASAAGLLPADPPLAASSNVHLLGHVPGTAAGMNFKGHYAFVTGWDGVTVLDIAKAAEPSVVGALPLPHFENEDVDLCGDLLLVANDREVADLGSVLYVVSIADPTKPALLAALPL